MSAIAGIVYSDPQRFIPTDLARMVQALAMYGRDAQQVWQQSPVAMAHLLFRTTPEDDYDQQPLLDSRFTLTFSGRLNNRAELIHTLGIPVQQAALLADSAIVLAAFRQWRENSFAKLVGEFALAIWDAQTRQMFLCRDLSGSEPLHWHRQAGFFAYASMPKGLFALSDIAKQLDEESLARFIVGLDVVSLYRGIQSVKPGHYLVLTQETIREQCFHRYDPERRIVFPRDTDYVEAFKEQFEIAVRCRLRSRGKIGAHLSSGFDSSTVSAVAASLLGTQSLTCFTAVPREGFVANELRGSHADEWPGAAQLAARHANITHLAVRASGDLLEPIDVYSHHSDQPGRGVCNMGWIRAIQETAAEHKVHTLLTGQMGNVGLSWAGGNLLPDLFSRAQLLRWMQEMQAMHRNQGRSWSGLLFQSVGSSLPKNLWQWLHQRGGQSFSVLQYTAIHPEWCQRFALQEQMSEWDEKRRCADSRPIRCQTIEATRDRLAQARLGFLASTGVERRDPTGDTRFMEFCLAIPEAQFMRQGEDRFILRQAYGHLLAEKTLTARTKGLQASDWYERAPELLPRIQSLLAELATSPLAAQCLDLPALNALVAQWPKTGWDQRETNWTYRFKLMEGLAVGLFILQQGM